MPDTSSDRHAETVCPEVNGNGCTDPACNVECKVLRRAERAAGKCRHCQRTIHLYDRWLHWWNKAEECGLGRTTKGEPWPHNVKTVQHNDGDA